MKRWVLISLSLFVLAIVGAAGYWGFHTSAAQASTTPEAPPTVTVTTCDVKQTVTAPGNLVNSHQVTLEMPANGSLEEVLVRPGDHAQAGQVLARLADRETYASSVAQARLDLLQANQELNDLKEGAAGELARAQLELANAQSALDETRDKRTALNYSRASDPLVVENAQTDYLLAKLAYKDALKEYNQQAHKRLTNPERAAALKSLLDAKRAMERALAIYNWYLLPASPEDIAKADGELAVAEASLAAAQEHWNQTQQGPDSVALALAEAKVNDAQATLEEAEKKLASVELKAPFDGVVLEVHGDPGESLAAGTKVIVLNDPQAVEVEATVTEEDFPRVEVGQEAEIFFDALPSEGITGTISRILPARAEGDQPLYTIYLSLGSLPEKLVAGMTADTSITIAQAAGALCLPRSLVRASAAKTAVLDVWNGASVEKRTVELGLRGDTYIQILSGLAAGDQVVGR